MKRPIVISIFFVALIFLSLCICQAQTYEAVTKDNEVSSINDVVVKQTTEEFKTFTLKEVDAEIAGLQAYLASVTTSTNADIAIKQALRANILTEAEEIILKENGGEE